MEQKVNPYRIEMLDYLRGIMAISVMSYHYFSWSQLQLQFPLNQIFSRLGIYAVSAFYILSGISLSIGYQRRMVDGDFIKEFFIKRFMRIAPLFYVVITMYLILIPLTYSYVISNYKLIFLNYSFLFAWVDPISYIAIGAWSIGNEWVFYSIFPLMLFLNNKSRRFYFKNPGVRH